MDAKPNNDTSATAAAAKQPAKAPLFPYGVLTPLERDGKRYEPGAKVELDAASAKPLLELKCVEPAAKD